MGKFLRSVVQCLSILILTLWAGAAQADKRVALVVGNSQYTHLTPRLANPANDAQDIAKALKSIGFEVIEKTDVGNADFGSLLAEFSRKLDGSDVTALFYYAGHGVQYRGQNYLLPIDIDVQDLADVEFKATPIDNVQRALDKTRGAKILILDACRNNPFDSQFAVRGFGGATRGLARIDQTQGQINFYATAPGQVASDGTGRNSPFTEALISRIKEPGVEINKTFRLVMSDVLAKTNHHQRPYPDGALDDDYFFIPAERDDFVWNRIRESNDEADFNEFIRKFPASPYARDAQARIDLFERIRRENEEEAQLKREREELDAEKSRQTAAAKQAAEEGAARQEAARLEAAKREAARLEAEKVEAQRKEAERLEAQKQEAARVEAEKAEAQRKQAERQEAEKKEAARIGAEKAEAARKEAERIAPEKSEAARLEAEKAEAQHKEAERLEAEKRAAKERTKIAAREEEDRKKRVIELEKQRQAEICNNDLAKLKDLTQALQTAAIQNLAKESTCPSIKPAIDTALKEVARGVKRACDADRKTLAAVKDNDIGTLKAAIDHLTCETVRAEAQQRVARLEDEAKRKEQLCAQEKQNLNAIDESAASASQQYVAFQSHAACATLRADVASAIKKIDERVKAAQIALKTLGCYNASINGQFDEATRKSLALYHSKKGSPADGDRLTDGLVSELQSQQLGLCPSETPIATPETPQPSTQQATHEENAEPGNNNRPNAGSGGATKEKASRPVNKHRNSFAAREEVPVSPPAPHKPHHAVAPPPPREPPPPRHSRPRAIARAPLRPPSRAAEAPASSVGHIHGVGF